MYSMFSGDLIGWIDVDKSESITATQSMSGSHKEMAESLDSVSELPSSCGQLQHLGKARPRRVKTRAPTRPMGRADLVEEDHDISEGSERGSIESLTRSDSLARSESDVTRDSPRPRTKSRDTEEEDEEEEEEQSMEEKSSRSVTSLIGKLASEGVLKRSPDMTARKASTSSNISSIEDKSRSEEDGKEDSPPRSKMAGLPKMGIGGNILAEMKMMQEKRTSFLPKEEDRDRDEKKENPSSSLLAGVRLRSTGLADSLKSPTNGFPRGSGGNRSPNCNRDSCIDTTGPSPNTKPVITALKPKPPPPLAPKPRPKSVIGGDRRSGEYESGDAAEDEQPPSAPVRSVREMAASLARVSVAEEAMGNKMCTSLPRNSASPTTIQNSERKLKGKAGPKLKEKSEKSETKKTADLINGIRKIERKKRQKLKELEETWVDGERGGAGSTSAPPLHRQTSHKHVLTTDLALEDVVNV
ncbi:putative F-actin-uncapping protein LRRC16A-like 3 [Homarus americanus]|uniref:Putative F-actin-uncapping protein LRRC16A-like 3 n=1 Tax=Homarus americanus TaxID=6706 RepID=A0A8J5N5P2_HOMAM|nr:putative F-actin-uncapping protein LRRC16A-like 3 [Homarus americanus]